MVLGYGLYIIFMIHNSRILAMCSAPKVCSCGVLPDTFRIYLHASSRRGWLHAFHTVPASLQRSLLCYESHLARQQHTLPILQYATGQHNLGLGLGLVYF